MDTRIDPTITVRITPLSFVVSTPYGQPIALMEAITQNMDEIKQEIRVKLRRVDWQIEIDSTFLFETEFDQKED